MTDEGVSVLGSDLKVGKASLKKQDLVYISFLIERGTYYLRISFKIRK